jgi:peptidoglycan/xylan/chitin deacetylase (PgdA/CDA1 family)
VNLRSQARAVLIRTAALARLDVLALRMQKLNSSRYGLIVAMHETPPLLEKQFRRQLEWASQHFTITCLESFAKLWDQQNDAGNWSKPPVLFTFDDGRESNYTVAAPLLESFGGRGVFFVVSRFAECGSTEQALPFYRTRINPDRPAGDETGEDWKAMSPAQIEDLAARGHTIGNHSLTHERLIGLTSEQLEREIGDSARKLTSWTKKPIDAFAWTFGWDAIDAAAWEVIRRYHRFCFSPCAGLVDSHRDRPELLWRREIEVRYSAPEFRFCYSGLVDLFWSSRRRRLREMLHVASE